MIDNFDRLINKRLKIHKTIQIPKLRVGGSIPLGDAILRETTRRARMDVIFAKMIKFYPVGARQFPVRSAAVTIFHWPDRVFEPSRL